MKLYEAISDILDRYGYETIKTVKLINFLSDYRAFDIKPAKTILRQFLLSGYGEKVYDLNEVDAPDKLIKLKNFGMELIQTHGFQEIHINYVLDSICYALGWMELPPEDLTDEFISSTSSNDRTIQIKGHDISMTFIKGGTFDMGATPEQGLLAAFDEKPSIEITVDDFFLCDIPVTQALWQAVMGENPSQFKGDNRPVERVSWNECMSFIGALNALSSFTFRLPTEAEWEYAARGGNKATHTRYAGADDDSKDDYMWHKGNSRNESHDVRGKSPNNLGLFDMSGNIAEWCSDWYFNSYANSTQRRNPTGPASGSNKVFRGGSWFDKAMNCRVSKRFSMNPDYKNKLVGLRLAASIQ